MLKQENVFLSILLSPVRVTRQAILDLKWFSQDLGFHLGLSQSLLDAWGLLPSA